MARIRVPESLSQLMAEITPELSIQLTGLIEKYRATDLRGRYLHWNDFKWRVEKGDNEVAAWIATKIARRSIAKELPLLQAEGDRYFSFCVPESLSMKLDAIAGADGKPFDLKIDSRWKFDRGNFGSSAEEDSYLVKNLMLEEAITSAQLEGSSTTRKVAKEMLEKNLTPQDKSQQMILNNYLLMKKAVEYKNEDLSIESILELHRIATYKAIDNLAASGEFRTDDNIIVSDLYNDNIFQPPQWESIPPRLNNLCDFANTDFSDRDANNFIHPIVKAIILHFAIGYIHPFGDGNGRTARAIFYWSMLRSGYWLFEYVSISKLIQESRSAYDRAFTYTETDDFDLTYFIYNQVDTIEKAVLSLYEHIDKKKRDLDEFTNWIEGSPIAKSLTCGHLEILKIAMREPGREFSVKQVAIDFGITEATARKYLKTLADKELLLPYKPKQGRSILYLAPANLKARLKL
jgi:Fic family protein